MVDADRARRLLVYDQQTGVFCWRESGRPAGCKTNNGYVVIGIDGRLFLAHRLAWLWMTGDWPDASIDHQNRVKDDNHWDNLRKATMAQNIANTGARATSKSGVKGVSWCKTANKWRAAITVNGKQRSLGRYSSLEDAARAYQEAASEIHGAYAATELGVTFYDLQEHA